MGEGGALTSGKIAEKLGVSASKVAKIIKQQGMTRALSRGAAATTLPTPKKIESIINPADHPLTARNATNTMMGE